MKNYVYLLALSCLALIGVLISITIYQLNIIPVIMLFVIVLLAIIMLKSENKSTAHIMENLELIFMFMVFIGLLYLFYSIYHPVNTYPAF